MLTMTLILDLTPIRYAEVAAMFRREINTVRYAYRTVIDSAATCRKTAAILANLKAIVRAQR